MEQIGSRAERMGLMGNAGIYLYSATRLEVCGWHLHDIDGMGCASFFQLTPKTQSTGAGRLVLWIAFLSHGYHILRS